MLRVITENDRKVYNVVYNGVCHMIVRKIKPEEIKRTNELFAIAFEFEMDNTKSADEVYQDTLNNPKSRDDVYCLERWAAFEDDNKTMMSNFH